VTGPSLPYLTAGPGLRAVFKARWEDFEVEELPARDPEGEGDHLWLEIEKHGLTTPRAASDLARALGVKPSSVGYAGMKDARAIARQWMSVEHVDPDRIGNERRVLLSELSGRANIIALTQRLDLPPDSELMDKILAEVVSKESEGYQFEAADGSFHLLVKRCMGTFAPHFQTLHYHVHVDNKSSGEVTAEAVVKIRVGDAVSFEAAEGHGPVDALDAALRKALNGRFPALNHLHLVDYKVRVIDSEAATAAWVRVVIESQDEDDVWGTVGVSENIIEASWIALIDSYEYKLAKDEEETAAGSQAKA